MLTDGVEVTVLVNDEPASEYATETVAPAYKQCFIESRDEQRFEIKVDMSQYPKGEYQWLLWVEGVRAEGEYFETSERHPTTTINEACWRYVGSSRTNIYKEMRFSKFEPVSEVSVDSNIKKDEEQMEGLGKIEVQVGIVLEMSNKFQEEWIRDNSIPLMSSEFLGGEGTHDNSMSLIPCLEDDGAAVIHEKSIKGRNLTHHVTFSNPRVAVPQQGAGTGPVVASFAFNYLSRGRLKDLGFIKEEDLSMEELRAEIKALRKQVQASESRTNPRKDVKKERGMKRRRTGNDETIDLSSE